MSGGGPEWFNAKRYGLGAGFPIAWQGWVLLIGFIAVIFGTAYFFRDEPLILFSIITPITVIFVIIVMKTTRGGWRWRWGKDKDTW